MIKTLYPPHAPDGKKNRAEGFHHPPFPVRQIERTPGEEISVRELTDQIPSLEGEHHVQRVGYPLIGSI